MSLRARARSLRNTVATWTGIGGRRQLLYISAECLLALRHEPDGWRLARIFHLQDSDALPLGPSNLAPIPWSVPEDFRRWIERWRGDEFRILIDSVDEEVEVDELPRVYGSDRVKLLNRRLRQRFRDAALTTWIAPRKKQSRTGPRTSTGAAQNPTSVGECTMMASLRQRNPMSLWIDAAVEAGARVSSIESPTFFAPTVLRAFGRRPTALLVSVQPAGLRETLVHDGEIRFTRLLPMAAPAAWSQVATELERTVRFLMMSRASLRPLIQAGTFPVYLIREGIDERNGTEPIALKIQLDADTVVPLIELAAPALPAARMAAAEEAQSPGTALGAVPTLLMQRGACRPGGYASTAMRRNWRIARSLSSVWSFALLSLVATVGANVVIGYTLHDVVDPTVQRQRALQIQAVRSQVQELEQKLAAMPVPAQDMEGVVELAGQLQSRHVDALATLQLVADGIDPDAALTVNDLSWEPERAVATAKESAGASAPAPNAAPPSDATTGTIVRVAGVADRSLTKAMANRKVEELLGRLRAACGCEGRVLELPYNPSMDVAYANSMRKPDLDHPPHFTIELDRPSAWIAEEHKPVAASNPGIPESPAAAPAALEHSPGAGGRDV